jgi:hypothetical protein
MLKWIENGFKVKLLVFSALFCGLAAGTKYNGLISVFVLTLFVPFLYTRYVPGRKPSFYRVGGFSLLFLSVAFVVFSPWMIRNYLWTDNPFYPLYDHLFNPNSESRGEAIGLFAYRSLIYKETWWQMVLLPARIFFQGQDGNPQYFDGRLNPFLLLLPITALYCIKDDSPAVRREKKVFFAYAILFYTIAFFSSGVRIRYLSPIIPPLVILSLLGVKKLVDSVSGLDYRYSRTIGFTALFLIVASALWLNGRYIFSQYEYVYPFGYLSGELNRDRYIAKYCQEYPVYRYVNEHLPRDSKILFIFMGKRGYYCDREYVLDMNFNKSLLQQLVRNSNGPADILRGMTERGISHLLIRYDIFDRWVNDSFTLGEREVLRNFFNRCVKTSYFKYGYGISRLEEPSP